LGLRRRSIPNLISEGFLDKEVFSIEVLVLRRVEFRFEVEKDLGEGIKTEAEDEEVDDEIEFEPEVGENKDMADPSGGGSKGISSFHDLNC